MYELHIKDLSYKKILTKVSFDWSQGEKLALMGANGSGKSTLGRIIAGLIEQDSGEVTLTKDEDEWIGDDQPRWRKIGFVGQHPRRQTIAATVAEELGFGLLNLGLNAPEVKERVKGLATQIGLESRLNQSIAKLSGGERQRLVMTAILALQPAFIILDESLSMLDLKSRQSILDLLADQPHLEVGNNFDGRKLGQLWITHDPEIALEADRLLIIQEGKIVEQGDPSHLLADEDRCQKYGIQGLSQPNDQRFRSIDTYPGNRPIVLSWKNAEFENNVFLDQGVKDKEFIGIVGPSGSGKTTLLESALQLIKPIRGSFQAFDEVSLPISPKQLRNGIRLLQQEAGEYLVGRTVYDEIFYTSGKQERRRNKENHEDYMKQMGIPEIQWQQDPQQLSGGERQKVALAAAMRSNPGIILFDEPLIGLDRQGRERFKAFLRTCRDKYTILYVTHDLEEILDMVTRVWLIEKGRITLDYEIENGFKERERLRRAGVKC